MYDFLQFCKSSNLHKSTVVFSSCSQEIFEGKQGYPLPFPTPPRRKLPLGKQSWMWNLIRLLVLKWQVRKWYIIARDEFGYMPGKQFTPKPASLLLPLSLRMKTFSNRSIHSGVTQSISNRFEMVQRATCEILEVWVFFFKGFFFPSLFSYSFLLLQLSFSGFECMTGCTKVQSVFYTSFTCYCLAEASRVAQLLLPAHKM